MGRRLKTSDQDPPSLEYVAAALYVDDWLRAQGITGVTLEERHELIDLAKRLDLGEENGPEKEVYGGSRND